MNKKYSKKNIKYRKNKTFRNVNGGDIAVDLIEYKIKENCPNEENSKKLTNIEEIIKNSKPMFSENFKKRLSNSLKSFKNISTSSKYVFSLLANPANVHRILFKNAYFIEFINFDHILKLYCGEPKKKYSGKELPEHCIILKKGYLFSKDKEVVANAEKETEKKTGDISDDAVAIENVLNSGDEKKANKDEEGYNVKKFIDEGFERLDFSKLNNALLTDDLTKNDNDNYYISFYPQYNCLFEYLHTFKYQFHRMLWSGGMFDWTYILEQTKELLDNNDDLHREFRKYNGLEKHDKYLGKFQEIYNNGGKVVQSVIDKDGKINENKINNIVDKLDEKPTKGGNLLYLNKVKQLGSKIVDETLKATSKNTKKYMIVRKLLQYYDFDPKEYNMNVLKNSGILKKNYPLFMEVEVRIALFTAIDCLHDMNYSIDNIEKKYDIISKNLDEKYPEVLKLLEEFDDLDISLDSILEFSSSKRGGSLKKNRTRKYSKGGIVFSRVLNSIFKQCSRLMVKKLLTNINSLIINQSEETIHIAKFISDVMSCAMNSGNILCFTLANFGLMPFLPAGTPHCILSNIAAILILFKLDYLGSNETIKTGKFDIHSIQNEEAIEIDTSDTSTKTNSSISSIKSLGSNKSIR